MGGREGVGGGGVRGRVAGGLSHNHTPFSVLGFSRFVRRSLSVDLQTATQLSARKALFSGVGLFVLRASGRGSLAVNAVGGILRYDLGVGEVRAIDNGHLVAWDAAMRYDVRMAAQQQGLVASMASSAVSGEGLMCFFEGPGRLWLQTHKPQPEAKGGKGGAGGRGNLCLAMVMMVVIVLVPFVLID